MFTSEYAMGEVCSTTPKCLSTISISVGNRRLILGSARGFSIDDIPAFPKMLDVSAASFESERITPFAGERFMPEGEFFADTKEGIVRVLMGRAGIRCEPVNSGTNMKMNFKFLFLSPRIRER